MLRRGVTAQNLSKLALYQAELRPGTAKAPDLYGLAPSSATLRLALPSPRSDGAGTSPAAVAFSRGPGTTSFAAGQPGAHRRVTNAGAPHAPPPAGRRAPGGAGARAKAGRQGHPPQPAPPFRAEPAEPPRPAPGS